MAAINQVMVMYSASVISDYTLKNFTIDDRASNGWLLATSNAGNSVTWGFWQANVTDGQGSIYKSYTTIKTGSKLRVGGTVSTSDWGQRVQCIFSNVFNGAIECVVNITWAATWGGNTNRWRMLLNWALLSEFSITSGTAYHIELEKTSVWFIGRLFDTNGTTLLHSFSTNSWNTPLVAHFQIWATTGTVPRADYCEATILT